MQRVATVEYLHSQSGRHENHPSRIMLQPLSTEGNSYVDPDNFFLIRIGVMNSDREGTRVGRRSRG